MSEIEKSKENRLITMSQSLNAVSGGGSGSDGSGSRSGSGTYSGSGSRQIFGSFTTNNTPPQQSLQTTTLPSSLYYHADDDKYMGVSGMMKKATSVLPLALRLDPEGKCSCSVVVV